MNRVIAKLGFILLTTAVSWLGCAEDEGDINPFPINELRVIESIPNSGDTLVDPFSQIEMRMNAAVITSSVQGRLRVTVANSGAAIQGFPSFSQGNTVIQFVSAGNNGELPNNTQIRVDLDAGVTSTGGLVSQAFTMFFSTGTGSGGVSCSDPGHAPVISVSPGDNSQIPMFDPFSGNPVGSGVPVFMVTSSQCIDPLFLDYPSNFLQIRHEPFLIGSAITVPHAVYRTGNPRVFMIGFYASLQSLDEVDMKFSAGLPDTDNDTLASGKTFDYTVLQLGF